MSSAHLPQLWMSFGKLIGDHLWQSTIFAGLVAFLTVVFGKQQARVRYGLWLAASVKFLIPFALLLTLGGQLGWRLAVPAPQESVTRPLSFVVEPFSHFLATSRSNASPNGTAESSSPALAQTNAPVYLSSFAIGVLLIAVWLFGSAAILLIWCRRWRNVARVVRGGTPVHSPRESAALARLIAAVGVTSSVGIVMSPKSPEPGVFGIRTPVLLWPENISDHLSDAQIEAILAHELAHIRRRDNLASAMHTLVQAIFWFYPLVWWIGAQMGEERERACDEDVLRLGGDPQAYAEGILKVCQFSLNSPIACVAGVSGSNLKKRIERIMENEGTEPVRGWGKILLAATGVSVLAGPLLAGALLAPRLATSMQAIRAAVDRGTQSPRKFGNQSAGAQYRQGSDLTALASEFQKWLNEDVVYIISRRERREFLALKSDTDREQFIQQFWQRRNPNGHGPDNPAKDEHYRRVAYANAHFTTTIPGWKTDRGRIFILYGPPDNSESHTADELWNRPDFGNGGTQTYAYEDWTYRYIKSLNKENVEIEFVDPSATGEFHLAANGSIVSGFNRSAAPGSRTVAMGDGTPPRSKVQTAAQADSLPLDSVSVRRNVSDQHVFGPIGMAGNHFRAYNSTLMELLQVAYQISVIQEAPPQQKQNNFQWTGAGSDPGLPPQLVAGLPAWFRTERFDIDADVSGFPGSAFKIQILQELLADQFKLKVHHEIRPRPVYALELSNPGKIGRQLHPDTAADLATPFPAAQPVADVDPGRQRLTYRTTMPDLAKALTGASTIDSQLTRPVVDRTGLGGMYDLVLQWVSGDPSRGGFFAALQEQAGLKLVPKTGSADVLVIDHVEQPSRN